MNKKVGKVMSCLIGTVMAVSSIGVFPLSTAADVTDIEAEYFVRGGSRTEYSINNIDALEIQKHLAQINVLTGDALLSADADGNGEVSINDAVNVMTWVSTNNQEMLVGDYVKKDLSPYETHYFSDGILKGASLNTETSGYLGSSCVSFDKSFGNYTAVKLVTDMTGVYKLRIRYSNGDASPLKMYVSANGSSQGVLKEFKSTGSWSEWSEAVVTIKLTEGENELYFISADENGSPYIDSYTACRYCGGVDRLTDIPQYEIITPQTTEASTESTTVATVPTTTVPATTTTTTTTTTTETTTTTTTTTTTEASTTTTEAATTTVPAVSRYYAVDAEYYNGVYETINSGYAGEAYVNYDNVTGSYVTWTVEVPEGGNYRVDFRFANGSTSNRITKISVNGVNMFYYMDFDSTGSWTDWSTNSVVLSLKAGTNTIKAVATTDNGGPNMDYIEIEKTDEQAAELVENKDGRQVENLSRGVSAAYNGSGVMVSWRILATDSENTTFKLYKNGQTPAIYEGSINEATCYFDSSGTASDWYTIDTFVNGEMTEFAQLAISLPNANSGQSGAYFDIPLDKPADMTMPDGTTCSYSPNDASVGDVDGDGDYEIILKWDPSNSQDNSKDGYTGNVYIDCYKLDGTKLWRVDLGKNIRAGAHYTQFMVYDYDGDGKAEMVCKTADGTVDGTGNVIGDGTKDYRSSAGRILEGPEYLTLFNGETGAALDTIDFNPGRGTVSYWGDSYGNRVDRFNAATAYLNGTTPSVVMCRGYYTRMAVTAYDVVDGKLVERWSFDTGHNSAVAGYGDGNHNCMPADLDGDGNDELVMGSAVIDHDGTLLYTSGLGHGDAMHVGDFDPENPGLEIFMCHEEADSGYGVSYRDGETGEILFRETATGDTGRCIADNLVAGNSSAELVGSHNGVVYDTSGNVVCNWSDITKWGQNSVVYWTGTLERCVLDRTMVDQYGVGRVFTGDGVTYNNSSKSNASITCDLFGDWREEMIFPTSDGNSLRVFGTTYTTEYGIYTLMQNTQYRAQVAGQNSSYNQPPHTDYFLGTGYDLPEFPEVYVAK